MRNPQHEIDYRCMITKSIWAIRLLQSQTELLCSTTLLNHLQVHVRLNLSQLHRYDCVVLAFDAAENPFPLSKSPREFGYTHTPTRFDHA